MTAKSLISNCLILFTVACLAFCIHFVINTRTNYVESIELVYAYCFNVVLACGIIVMIVSLKKRLRDQLGFVFMGASMIKFVFFFIFFYPKYNADGDLSRAEFLTFFIPYVVCLVVESIILSKFFNKLNDLNS